MTLRQHEIDSISERILAKIADRLDGTIRVTIRREMKHMTDQAILDLRQATDAIVGQLAAVVSLLQTDAAALAAALASSGAALGPDIEDQVARLTAGTQAAANAVAALQANASAPAAAPASDAGPAAAPASSPAAAPADAAPAAPDTPAS